MKTTVSIITVNYNQAQVTRELLQSIEKLRLFNESKSNLELEVIVVDNASGTNDTEQLQQEFPWIKAIRSEKNLGFAGGNNLGYQQAIGDYIFYVNNDTEIIEGTIEDLVFTFNENPQAGAVNPLIYYYDQPEVIQFAGYTPINKLTGRNTAVGYGQKLILSDKVTKTPYGHGAALMVKREVIDQIGGMPESYFLYYEELDWGQQIKERGYEILVSHRSRILHKESISTGKDSPLKTYFQTRNRILFMRRNYDGIGLMMFLIFFALLALPNRILRFAMNREWSHLRSFSEGIKWHFQNRIDSHQIGYIYDDLRS